MPLLASLGLNLRHLEGRPDVTVSQALKLLSTDVDVKTKLEKNKHDVQMFMQMYEGYLAKIGMQESGGKAGQPTDEELMQLAQYSLFDDLPNAFLKKISKLSFTGEFVTYVFALVTSLVGMQLKEGIEEMERQEKTQGARKKKPN